MFLNVTPFRQPSPKRNPGGDCFACSVKAIADYFFPENPPTFDQVWEAFESDGKCSYIECERVSSKHLMNHWSGMYRAFQNLHALGYEFDWEIDLVHPEVDEERFSHAFGWHVPEMKWHRRVENWLKSGWLLLIEMSYDSITIEDRVHRNKYFGTDHFAVIDGQRFFWKPHYDENGKKCGGTGTHETHVVCSAKGPYWIDSSDLHYYHGVNAFYAVRRDVEYEYRDYSWNLDSENQAKISDR